MRNQVWCRTGLFLVLSMMLGIVFSVVLSVVLSVVPGIGQQRLVAKQPDDGDTSAKPVDYASVIKPLLLEKCAACHGALNQESGLRIDAGQLLLRGGDGGPVITPGSAADSLLFERVIADDIDERMPPEGTGEALNGEQTALLKAWIESGASAPQDEAIPRDPRLHWAYQRPSKAALPLPGGSDVNAEANLNPIDAFLHREQKRLGLVTVPIADRYTRLRRAHMDLLGLPPTPKQIEAFVDSTEENAWESVVDALLESPRFGERWGRHWMDVWRYSDWSGYKQQVRGSQRHIWRWRDWIIDSLNDDKGYDQMIVEMLAADEMAPADDKRLVATGFLVRNFHNSNRNIWLDATAEHTAKAFLGMTINCARCHDHKYDPIAQSAYYQFRAIFEPHNVRIDQMAGQTNLTSDGIPRAYDADLDAKTFLFQQGNEKHPDEDHPMLPAVPEVMGGELAIESIELPLDAYYPAINDFVAAKTIDKARQRLKAAQAKLSKLVAAAESKPGAEVEATSLVAKTMTQQTVTQQTVTQQTVALQTAELEASIAKLRVRSLESRLAADRAKYSSGVDADKSKTDADKTDTGKTDSDDKPSFKALASVAANVEATLKMQEAELALMQKQSELDQAQSALASAETDAENSKDADKKAKSAEEVKKKTESLKVAKEAQGKAQKAFSAAAQAAGKKGEKYTPLGKEYPKTSTGRRLALARWIANEQNPLTARVAVNHIWLRHFGSPLVDNVFDFGLRSPKPVHADLLDWLAVELMENQWSLKHIHRLIVTSKTWQQSSTAKDNLDQSTAENNRRLDPENRYLWRMNSRRLDAEIVRDNLLAVSGNLDTTLGGADIDYSQGEVSHRRSIYFRHAYEKQMTMLVLFDAASPNECYRRSESIIPQQALALANSPLAIEQSRALGEQLWRVTPQDEASREASFVRLAFLRILSRQPTESESKACLRFLKSHSATLADTAKLHGFAGGADGKSEPASEPLQRARDNLVHVLMNHNDFISVR